MTYGELMTSTIITLTALAILLNRQNRRSTTIYCDDDDDDYYDYDTTTSYQSLERRCSANVATSGANPIIDLDLSVVAWIEGRQAEGEGGRAGGREGLMMRPMYSSQAIS